ncbi:MAG: beta-propeller fold lactonase family protein [Anaerolineae bacterium]|nr:beta-propeller fold lactonase family protein [Anaerolineae bacterium]
MRRPDPDRKQALKHGGALPRITIYLCATSVVLAVLWASKPAPVRLQTSVITKAAAASIAITPNGASLIVINPDSNTVSLIDTVTLTIRTELPVEVNPVSVAVTPDGALAFIANQGSDSLTLVDIEAGTVVDTIEVGDRPAGVAVSPNSELLAVAELGDDQVRLLNVANLETVDLVSTIDRPRGLAFTPDGRRLLITHLLSGSVTVIPVMNFRCYLPLVLSSQAEIVEDYQIQELPSSSSQESTAFSVPTWPNIAPAPAVIINGAGTRAYLPQTMANGLGYNTGFDTTVFPKVSVLNLETDTHQTSEHISLPETDRPVGLPWDAALARNDTELWVVNSASNDLSVINISNPTHPTRVANIPVGDNPRGVVLSPDGSTAYVNNTLAGTVSVVDANSYSVTEVITVTTIPLPPTLLRGKQLFFSSARPDLAQARWISCNTCHIEGEQDGRTWLLQYLGGVPPGEEPVIRRNTSSLLGMIETYPLRWSAEWNESADSEFSVRFEQFGTGLIDGDMYPTRDGPPNQGRSHDLDCLALFIDSLIVPTRTHALTPAELRGKAIFESAETQCAVCHPAPLYTDLQVHDVGTAAGPGEWFGLAIDTPTLRFLYDSAPYLHDGSAATLYEMLTAANSADRHGKTSHLTHDQLADLVAFLMSLPYDGTGGPP